MKTFLRRLIGLFGRSQDERELAAEIEEHLALATTENIRRGMTPEAARRIAGLAVGPGARR